ncbi:MAG: hypothetical protein NZL98_02195 [Anaerolineales bacterium]|nr:hypothetical protein [Anaerolineales bacterium]MDW8226573.1 hypothetical protein [Anaerolineales bacterium]
MVVKVTQALVRGFCHSLLGNDHFLLSRLNTPKYHLHFSPFFAQTVAWDVLWPYQALDMLVRRIPAPPHLGS